jgi:hypothetical protein
MTDILYKKVKVHEQCSPANFTRLPDPVDRQLCLPEQRQYRWRRLTTPLRGKDGAGS